MCRFENDRAGCSRLLHLKPARSADTPAISGFEAHEAKLRHRRRKVIAQSFAGSEKILIDDTADGVDAEVGGAGIAASIAEEAGHGIASTDRERLAKDIFSKRFGWFSFEHGFLRDFRGPTGCGRAPR